LSRADYFDSDYRNVAKIDIRSKFQMAVPPFYIRLIVHNSHAFAYICTKFGMYIKFDIPRAVLLLLLLLLLLLVEVVMVVVVSVLLLLLLITGQSVVHSGLQSTRRHSHNTPRL